MTERIESTVSQYRTLLAWLTPVSDDDDDDEARAETRAFVLDLVRAGTGYLTGPGPEIPVHGGPNGRLGQKLRAIFEKSHAEDLESSSDSVEEFRPTGALRSCLPAHLPTYYPPT